MHRVEELPDAFARYHDIGGALDFAIFDGADGDDNSMLAAISSLIPDLDQEMLRVSGFREVDQQTFFGGWYDLATGELQPPPSSYFIEDAGSGGDFARAFSHPPYGLRAPHDEVQGLLNQILGVILPEGQERRILDWSGSELAVASPYFELGMEWWGVFLFTIHMPALRRVTVIAGSTTD